MSLLATLRSLREPCCQTSVFDTAGTAVLAWLAAGYFDWDPVVTTVGAFGLGFATHFALGIKTVFNK